MTDETIVRAPESHCFDATHPPPLDFEAWSAISAELVDRDIDEREAILDGRKLEGELWEACNRFWVQEIAQQVARSQLKLAARYGQRCAEVLALRPRRPSQPPAPSDETAFLTALPDDTALPFAGLRAEMPRVAEAPHPDAGATQEAAALDVSTPIPLRPRSK